jgi:cytochrome c peroxidase
VLAFFVEMKIRAKHCTMTESIAKFEKTKFFAPFDSKYDRYLVNP